MCTKALNYLVVGTQPDMAYSVSLLVRFAAKPGTNHWRGVECLIAYLADSADITLNIFPTGGELAKSTYGILMTFYGCLVLWTSRCFATMAVLTCQAKYMALGIGTRQVLWAAMCVSTDDLANKRVRHVDREFYLTNQSLYEKKTELVWVPTKEQLAVIFTEALSRDPFESFRRRIMHRV
ncbi:hypothetical protein MJO28_006941 [Puccinia striiformis f. sp. tritici]|uniref:Uncharacterized protein n=1 Tax=Puccinia striiformis f. sp. tritici TaxID=168172 RepID=A0ACC0ECL4_9BASI|nr:hypothetical protein MJO28_006941 [Puccinia striiformis f. sp. tritici]